MTNVEPLHALNMDINQQQAFVRFYRNLSEKTSATVRFFNHSDYYTAHAEDATLASEVMFGSKVIKLMGIEPKLPYIVLSRSNFEKFIRELLLVRQYRVEVYSKPNQSRNNDWNLEYKGSPGNLTQFEELLFENSDNAVFNSSVLGVKHISKNMLAVACVNTTESKFYVCEFLDNDFYTQLDVLIAQIGPKECIIPQGESPELLALKTVLERCNILVVRAKKSHFSTEEIEQDLNRLLLFHEGQQRNAMALAETNLTAALCSLQAVIKYLNLTGDESNFNQFKISSTDILRYPHMKKNFMGINLSGLFSLGRLQKCWKDFLPLILELLHSYPIFLPVHLLFTYVRLDTAAISALNLFPKTSAVARNKYDSIFGAMDNCVTAQGRRLLEQWLKQPLKDLNLINERLEVVETLVRDTEARSTLTTSCLTRVPDMLMLAKKLSGKKATLQDCYKIYQVVDSIPSLLTVLRSMENKYIKELLINPLADVFGDLEKYQAMIESTIDLDLVNRGEFVIKPQFDDSLKELHKNKEELQEQIQKALKHAASNLGVEATKVLKLDYTDQYGYFFRLTLKDESILRKNKRFKIIGAIKGGVRFRDDKLAELNEDYLSEREAYEKQQKTVVVEILQIAAGYIDSIKNLNMCTAKIDVLVSFANTAASAPTPYVKPKLHPEGTGILRLIKARHPCLERQDDCIYIPNDLDLKQDETVLSIITGPNMGGKSTYMRSIGSCVLLAHIGSLIPCREAEISLVDCILARVGADDCELKGLSTFMLEMVETCGIVRSATSNSLVIVDELGRGTSTYDGCGIAWAIAEHLAKELKSFTLFATHYYEITQLSESIPTVQNLHASAVVDKDTITPLYQIKKGSCDKSYGIHCARLVNFPQDVIDNAINYQQKLEFAGGMKYIANYEPCIKRKIVEEGDALIEETLEKLKKYRETLSDDELVSEILKLKEDLMNRNLFFRGLLESKE